MKSSTDNQTQEQKFINYVLDKIFTLPAGHEEVSAILKDEFLKKYQAQFVSTSPNDADDLQAKLTNLLTEFLSDKRTFNNNIKKVIKIYEQAIDIEVKKIATTEKGRISTSINNRNTYKSKPPSIPEVKDFVVEHYNSTGSCLVKTFKDKLLKEFRRISQPANIFQAKLKFINDKLQSLNAIFSDYPNYQQEAEKQATLDLQTQRMITGLDKKPFFVVNTPMYVPVNEHLPSR